ncbi:S8 family serine peptidase [Streptomyces sp. DSM 41982]|uniref:S8 family serine peptidase n=1 Tax=Streptomyces evansiae TaxID=3075535 RepID=A0ABD5E5V0_9ACTN|nr:MULTISPECIES: S8 family serine peptidase [unclassified Streptomyces]MDT0416744.1 S8 family serine peptidase [Streptomyces sp. DSM 41982]SCD56115.1 Serine protease, subtilisin family [Streptomyces sp. SolWspMP-sol7th]
MSFLSSTTRWRRLLAATTVLATTALGPVFTTASAGAASAVTVGATASPVTGSGRISPPSPGKTAGTTVTLVTGDTVTVTKDARGRERATIAPARDSSRTFRTLTGPDGDLYVYPSDALAPLAAHTLDSAVFNVSRLIRDGYADAKKKTLPVIVSYADRPSGRTLDARAEDLPGSTRRRVMDRLGMAALTVDKKNAGSFWKSALPPARGKAAKTGGRVAHLWYDAPVKTALDRSVPQIHAPEVWKQGYDGTGTKVAVLDTGIDLQHADVKDRVLATKSFAGTATVQDGHGHGTHVASTIAGSGADSGGEYKGVTPGASLLIGKVLGDSGSGDDSNVIAGMEWAVEQGADVVSMSLGSDNGRESDPSSVALERLSAGSDTLFVVAAGNSGPGASTLGSPGVAESALTVGAVDRDDSLAPFSSRGPRADEDHGIKPDVTAPGVDIVAARAAGTSMGQPVDAYYTAASGTSMATPHVAGAAALLAQRHPDWDGKRLKEALVSHSMPSPGATVYAQGTGRIDVAASLDAPVGLSGKADFGMIWYPGRGVPYEKPTRTLTVRNAGDKPTTVRLAARSTTEPLPAGALTFDHDEVTVPADGTTEVTATLDPRSLPAATYSGEVTATTAGGATARAALGFTKEAEQYGVTVNLKDRNGDAPANGILVALGLDEGSTYYQTVPFAKDAKVTLRMPQGRYAFFGGLTTGDLGLRGGYGDADDVFSLPDVEVGDEAKELTVDARTAQDVRFDVKGERALENSTFAYGITRAGAQGAAQVTLSGDATISDAHHGAIPVGGKQSGLTASFYQRERVPLVAAEVTGRKGFPLSVRVGGGSFRFEGARTARVTDIGTGTPEEREGKPLTGRAVLIHADLPDDAIDALAEAQEAGAAAVLVTPVHDRSTFAQPYGGLLAPVLVVSHKDGTALAARAATKNGATVRLTGTKESPRAYSGRWDHTRGIPADLSSRLRRADFARVDNRFHASADGQIGEYQQHVAKGTKDPLEVSVPEELLLGTERAEYLYAAPGLTYQQDVSPTRFTATQMLGASAPARAGYRSTEDWFGPVPHFAPYGSGLGCNFCNTDQGVVPWPALVGDSEAHHSSDYGGTLNRLALLRGGAELPPADWRLPERDTYRIESDMSYGPDDGALEGARATAAYDFVAGPPTRFDKDACTGSLAEAVTKCEPLPLITTHYSLATDLHNKVTAGRPYSFTLSGHRVTGFKGSTRLKGATVDVSFDNGKTWQHAKTARTTGTSFRVSYPQPRRSASSGTVALRATLWDGQGNRTEETVLRAYTLK